MQVPAVPSEPRTRVKEEASRGTPLRPNTPRPPHLNATLKRPLNEERPTCPPPLNSERKPTNFRELLKPEDFSSPRRVVPPPYPEWVNGNLVSGCVELGGTKPSKKMCKREMHSPEKVSHDWDRYYPEGDLRKWDTDSFDQLVVDEPCTPGPLEDSYGRPLSAARYSYADHYYGYHGYGAYVPAAGVRDQQFLDYGEGLRGRSRQFPSFYHYAPLADSPRCPPMPPQRPWEEYLDQPPPPPPPDFDQKPSPRAYHSPF